ncbi:Rpn family recombination-promoting nuclease/putative transposase [Clostridium chromiireducens]|uniref:Rpn family recombination-promoting nuclease/putative transposase n=2 Tax=Clostridium chromiireducens TaxID=225345 RepID=A0A964W4L4_9CLOT|nr:Rpn family recombination-promoting nuclease/putative transposase [Clostridium chromiireducens]
MVRCEMVKLLDPKNDLVFQKLFGMKKHKHILIAFLNAVLRLNGLEKIKDVSFEEKQLDVTLLTSEKLSILDLHVVTETSININVEIQLVNQYNMIKRTIFYLSKMILSQLKKGEDYSSLSRTITINILNFSYLEEENFINNYIYHNKITKKILSDLCEIIFIELPKFNNAHKDYNDKLHKWLTFLANPSGEEIQDMAKTDSEIKEAMNVLYNISSDEELRRLIDLRELAIMDEQNRLNGAKKEGIEQGKADILIKQLVKKFKTLPDEYRKKIKTLSEETIDVIATDIFDMESVEDLKKYI